VALFVEVMEKHKERFLDSDFVKDFGIVVGLPLGIFIVVVIGYLIFEFMRP
jgi:hypothetical protein